MSTSEDTGSGFIMRANFLIPVSLDPRLYFPKNFQSAGETAERPVTDVSAPRHLLRAPTPRQALPAGAAARGCSPGFSGNSWSFRATKSCALLNPRALPFTPQILPFVSPEVTNDAEQGSLEVNVLKRGNTAPTKESGERPRRMSLVRRPQRFPGTAARSRHHATGSELITARNWSGYYALPTSGRGN